MVWVAEETAGEGRLKGCSVGISVLRRRTTQSLLVGLTVLAALFIAFGPSGGNTAYAAPNAATQCVMTAVHVTGQDAATTSCLKYAPTVARTSKNPNGILPQAILEDHCNTSTNYRLEIVSALTGIYCFWGDGYLGLGGYPALGIIQRVSEVRSLEYLDWAFINRCGSGWVLYYLPNSSTGTKFYFGNCHTFNSGNSVFDAYKNIRITQVSLNA